MRRSTALMMAASALATLSWSGAALAQDAAPAVQEDQVEEIVVTARKRSERLFDVPVAVTAVTAETLEDRQFQSVRDIAQVTPGLNISSDSAGRANISIRGVGITLLDTVQPGVGIFVDGIYQPNTSYLSTPTLALEQIEILRGPQGTLFGQNTLGGAINITTRQPSDVVEGRIVGAFAGPDNFYTAGATIAGPIVRGQVAGRLTVGAQGRDGFVENSLLGYDDANSLEQQTIRGALRFQLPASAELTVNAYYDRIEGSNPVYSLTTGPEVYTSDSQYNYRSYANFDYLGLNARLIVPLGENTDMTVIGSWDRRELESGGDQDFQPIILVEADGTNEQNTYTGEVRFDTRWSDTVTSLVGVFASTQDSFTFNNQRIVPLSISVDSTVDTEASLYAAFGTVFWNFAPDWELAVGLRFDHQTVDSVAAIASTYEADEWQPRVTLRRSFGDSMVYASVARGFRGGGANGPGAPNAIFAGDSVWTTEFGARSRLNGGQVIVSGAVFYNDYSDVIGQNSLAPRNDGVPGFVGINLNSGDARSIGIEGEITAFVTDAWTLRGGFLFQNARFTDTSQYTDTTGRTLPSDRFTLEPDWTVSLQSDYVVPFADGEVTISGGFFGKGDRIGASLSNTFAPELDEYFIANLSVAWRRDNLELAVFANNVFDTEYYESYVDSSLLTALGVPALGSLGLIGDGRRVGVRFGYNF